MKYNVGQVVYLLNQKSLTIIPALIVEEVIRKTIEEESKQYILEFPGEDNKRVVLDKVSARIFNDTDTLRDYMIENTRQNIEKLIVGALEKRDLFYGSNDNKSQSSNIDKNDDKKIENSDIKRVQKDVKEVIMNSKDNKTKTKEGKWKKYYF